MLSLMRNDHYMYSICETDTFETVSVNIFHNREPADMMLLHAYSHITTPFPPNLFTVPFPSSSLLTDVLCHLVFRRPDNHQPPTTYIYTIIVIIIIYINIIIIIQCHHLICVCGENMVIDFGSYAG